MIIFLIGGTLVEREYQEAIHNEQWCELEQLSRKFISADRHRRAAELCHTRRTEGRERAAELRRAREKPNLPKVLALPPKARAELSDFIGLCRSLRDDAPTRFGHVWFDKLSAALEAEKRSKQKLDDLLEANDFFAALGMGLDGELPIPEKELRSIYVWLKQVSDGKKKLMDWYEQAQDQVSHVPRKSQTDGRPKYRSTLVRTALSVLVASINRCFVRHTRTPISTQHDCLEFVKKVCEIAFPDLGKAVRKGPQPQTAITAQDFIYARVRKAIEKLMSEMPDEPDEGEFPLNLSFNWLPLIPDWQRVEYVEAENEHCRVIAIQTGDLSSDFSLSQSWLMVMKKPSARGAEVTDVISQSILYVPCELALPPAHQQALIRAIREANGQC